MFFALFFACFLAYDANFNQQAIYRRYVVPSLVGIILHTLASLVSQPTATKAQTVLVLWTLAWLLTTQLPVTATLISMWHLAERGTIVVRTCFAWAWNSSIGVRNFSRYFLQRAARLCIASLSRSNKPDCDNIQLSDKPVSSVLDPDCACEERRELPPAYDEAAEERDRVAQWPRRRAIAQIHFNKVKQQDEEEEKQKREKEALRKAIQARQSSTSRPAPIKRVYQPDHVHPSDKVFYTPRLHDVRRRHCIAAHEDPVLAEWMLDNNVPLKYYDNYQRMKAQRLEREAFAAAQAAVVQYAPVPEAPVAEKEVVVPEPATSEVSVPEVIVTPPLISPVSAPVAAAATVTPKRAPRQDKSANKKALGLQRMLERNASAFGQVPTGLCQELFGKPEKEVALPVSASFLVPGPALSPFRALVPSPVMAPILQAPLDKKPSAKTLLLEKTLARNPAAFSQVLLEADSRKVQPSKTVPIVASFFPASRPTITASTKASPAPPASAPAPAINAAMAKKQEGDDLKRALQQRRREKKAKK